ELLAGAEDAPHAQHAFGREQVAVLPDAFDLEALAGAVADPSGDRPRARLRHLDRDVDRARLGADGRLDFHRGGRDAADQAGGEDRAPEVELEAALVEIARIEPGNVPELPAGKGIRQVAGDLAGAALAARGALR